MKWLNSRLDKIEAKLEPKKEMNLLCIKKENLPKCQKELQELEASCDVLIVVSKG